MFVKKDSFRSVCDGGQNQSEKLEHFCLHGVRLIYHVHSITCRMSFYLPCELCVDKTFDVGKVCWLSDDAFCVDKARRDQKQHVES